MKKESTKEFMRLTKLALEMADKEGLIKLVSDITGDINDSYEAVCAYNNIRGAIIIWETVAEVLERNTDVLRQGKIETSKGSGGRVVVNPCPSAVR